MALTEPTPPDRTRGAFLEGLGVTIDQAQLRISLPLYTLSVEDLAKEAGDLSPYAIGWYFAAMDATGGFIAGEVPDTLAGPDSSQPVTTSLRFGLLVDAGWKAYDVVKEHPELQAEPFQLRWLRIAGLRIEAFWLKAAPFDGRLDDDDRVFAFLAFQPELKNQLVSGRDFRGIARKVAAASLLIDNSPRLYLSL